MSLISISLPSFNTLANCATFVWAVEAAFRGTLKSKSIVIFSDSSTIGRAVHQCLDISQYLLGTALFLSLTVSGSTSRKIAAPVLCLFAPLFCKAICQTVSEESVIYRIADHIVQVMRVGIKFGFVAVAIKNFRHTEPGMAQLLGVVQIVGFTMVSMSDALETTSHLISRTRDFYLSLRWGL